MTKRSTDVSSALSTADWDHEQEDDPTVLAMIEALDTVPDPCCILSGKDLFHSGSRSNQSHRTPGPYDRCRGYPDRYHVRVFTQDFRRH